MKTAIRIMAAGLAASLALVSCAKQEAMDNGSTSPAGGARTIAVSFANASVKSSLGEDGLTPKFVAGDVIKVSNGSATEDCTVEIDGSGNASITTELTGALTMVYPAAAWSDSEPHFKVSTEQNGTFASANICKAIIAEKATEASFENQTAVLRFYVDASIGVKSLKLESTSNIATDAKTITVDPEGDDTLDSVTDGPDKRLCYVSVLSGVNANTLTLTSETTTQGTVTRPKPMADVELAAGTMYNAFIPYYIKIKVSDSPTYQKWAYCNVGAFLPEDYGEYFAWGETGGRTPATTGINAFAAKPFKWSNAPFNNGNSDYDATYFSSVRNTVCPDDILAKEYDAAHVNWGGTWCMNKSAEFQALKDATYWAWDSTDKGYYVFKADATHPAGTVVTFFPGDLNKADALLFFPAAGFGTVASLDGAGSLGLYCSSSLNEANPYFALSLCFFSYGYVDPQYRSDRCHGFSVRPLSD